MCSGLTDIPYKKYFEIRFLILSIYEIRPFSAPGIEPLSSDGPKDPANSPVRDSFIAGHAPNSPFSLAPNRPIGAPVRWRCAISREDKHRYSPFAGRIL
jgi:hypothetical protein